MAEATRVLTTQFATSGATPNSLFSNLAPTRLGRELLKQFSSRVEAALIDCEIETRPTHPEYDPVRIAIADARQARIWERCKRVDAQIHAAYAADPAKHLIDMAMLVRIDIDESALRADEGCRDERIESVRVLVTKIIEAAGIPEDVCSEDAECDRAKQRLSSAATPRTH